MTREEAINKIRQWSLPKETRDILEALAPELRESDDERMLHKLIDHLDWHSNNRLTHKECDELRSWLEKQKKCLADNSKTSASEDKRIRESLIEFLTAIKAISESGRTAWAVRKEDAEMCKSFIAWLEKQKEPKHDATDAKLERVIKAARRVLNNWLDGTDCPDVSGDFAELEDAIREYDGCEKQKEQKPDGDDETEVQKAYREGKNAGRKEVFDNPEYYGLQLRRMYDYETGERNPEWSDEDKKMLNHLIDKIQENWHIRMPGGCYFGISNDEKETFSSWLRYLPERFNLPPKQEWKEVELEFRGEKVKIKRPFFRDDKGREYSTTEQDEDVAWYALRAWCDKKGISLYDLYPKVE